MNYYNEFDPKAAQWLRNLITAGLIPAGDVDERSITEIKAHELKQYTQCHFFAGIGGWSYALQLAGWPTDRPVWTGSCPCQPFSSAGRQKGKDDERHLWPVWFELIRQSRPPIVFGEQVSAAIRHHWWDDVADDLEREGYTTRAEIRPACSVGAPHKRDRLWFVANAKGIGCDRGGENIKRKWAKDKQVVQPDVRCEPIRPCGMVNVADTSGQGLQGCWKPGKQQVQERRERTQRHAWAGGVWIDCPDGKQRLIEPSIPLLASRVSARVAQLRGLGNAIVPQVAAEFISTYMESENVD